MQLLFLAILPTLLAYNLLASPSRSNSKSQMSESSKSMRAHRSNSSLSRNVSTKMYNTPAIDTHHLPPSSDISSATSPIAQYATLEPIPSISQAQKHSSDHLSDDSNSSDKEPYGASPNSGAAFGKPRDRSTFKGVLDKFVGSFSGKSNVVKVPHFTGYRVDEAIEYLFHCNLLTLITSIHCKLLENYAPTNELFSAHYVCVCVFF